MSFKKDINRVIGKQRGKNAEGGIAITQLMSLSDPYLYLGPNTKGYWFKKVVMKLIKPYTRYQIEFNRKVVEVLENITSR